MKYTLLLALLLTNTVFAAEATTQQLNLTLHTIGIFSLIVFVVAYALVMLEEVIHLKKSVPVIISAVLIWMAISLAYSQNNLDVAGVESALRHSILEFAELMLFLLVAMTYINALTERRVFNALRSKLISMNFSYRKLFWITGILAFFISPVADNLTTALILCAVLLAVGGDNKKFIAIGCINIVVCANAGGAFSPFGDITTLMVWQKGKIDFFEFFVLFIPAVVNALFSMIIMSFFISKDIASGSSDKVVILRGGYGVMLLFALTIVTAVSTHNFFHLPPALGMMLGLGYLKVYAFYLRQTETKAELQEPNRINISGIEFQNSKGSFDVLKKVAAAEWDTLLFFFGVIVSVGGLGFIGYLEVASQYMYYDLGTTTANILVGFLSAIVDNIPVMFAVLSMDPAMSHNQWLLVTLTAGVGGSMLSIGSAAGVALMGQSKGMYTFGSHLKWTPVLILGYLASIGTHLLLIGA